MLKSIHRLTTDRQFQQVRSRGKSWAHPFMVLVAAPNGLDVTRCGFSVGKRLGKAHDRNYIKRAIREAVRVRHPGLKTGFDLVWIARTGAKGITVQTDFWAIDTVVEDLLRRARLVVTVPPEVASRPRPVVSPESKAPGDKGQPVGNPTN